MRRALRDSLIWPKGNSSSRSSLILITPALTRTLVSLPSSAATRRRASACCVARLSWCRTITRRLTISAVCSFGPGVEMNKEDPGVHYQLFLTYSRQNAKPDADRELALFKSLEEARKSREAGSGMADSTKNQLPAPESAGSVSSKQRPQL